MIFIDTTFWLLQMLIRKVPSVKFILRKGDIAQLWNHRHFPLIHKMNADPFKLCQWHLYEVTYLVNVQIYYAFCREISLHLSRRRKTVKKFIVINVYVCVCVTAIHLKNLDSCVYCNEVSWTCIWDACERKELRIV